MFLIFIYLIFSDDFSSENSRLANFLKPELPYGNEDLKKKRNAEFFLEKTSEQFLGKLFDYKRRIPLLI